MEKIYKSISLFSGAGGLDIGIERSGFEVVCMNELDPVFTETLRANKSQEIQISKKNRKFLQNADIICEDIRKLSPESLAEPSSKIDLVFGGPPCQTFSSAGKMESVRDQRGRLFKDFIRIVHFWKPTAFLFENVRGLVTARGEDNTPGSVLKEIFSSFERCGYSCRATLLNAADYGAYQRRVRCFIIGVRYGKCPEFPNPTHSREARTSGQTTFSSQHPLKPWNTLGNFLQKYADMNEDHWVRPTEKMAGELKKIPIGSGFKSPGIVERTRPGGHWGYRQGTFIADPRLPARTVTGSSTQDWIRLMDGSVRRLTFREVSRLQGFPDNWIFSGSNIQKFKQVGNAVPTIFGEILGRTIIDYLSHNDYNTPPIKFDLPPKLHSYIDYTIREEKSNGPSRHKRIAVPKSCNL